MSVTINNCTMGRQGSSGTTVYIQWMCDGTPQTVDTYKSKYKKGSYTAQWIEQISGFNIHFTYCIDGVWYNGDFNDGYSKDSTTSDGYYRVTYSAPSDATEVRGCVWTVAATYNGRTGKGTKKKPYKAKTQTYAAATNSGWQSYNLVNNIPDTPSAPTTSLDGLKLTLTTTTSDVKANRAWFYIYKGSSEFASSGWLDIVKPSGAVSGSCSWPCETSLDTGFDYYARVKHQNTATGQESGLSDSTSVINTPPAAPNNLKCTPQTTSTIYLTWDEVTGISSSEGYTVEYTTNESFFGTSTGVASANSSVNHLTLQSLETGYTYYFRVKANNAQGSSGWSNVVSQVVASKPGIPSTWTISSSISVGSKITFYWVHNATDSSKMSEATITYKIGSGDWIDHVYTPVETEEEIPIYSWELDTSSASSYPDGTIILWKVKTKGAHADYSDYSVERSVKFYENPSVTITGFTTPITSYPISVILTTAPVTQTPISYSIVITNTSAYTSQDIYGNDKYLAAGTNLYSKIIVSNTSPYTLTLTPSDITLQSSQSYRITVSVSMNSGLIAKNTRDFTVQFTQQTLMPGGDVIFNDDGYYNAKIMPCCYVPSNNYIAEVVDSSYENYTSWNKVLTPSTTIGGTFLAVTYGDRFVVMGSKTSHYSFDGKTWTSMTGISSLGTKRMTCVCYGDGTFVTVGSATYGYYSTDGETWIQSGSFTVGASYYGIIYGNGKFVVVGSGGLAISSEDGATWTAMTGLDTSGVYKSVAYGNGRFVCVGEDGISAYSTDGETWTQTAILDVDLCYGKVAYGNGRFVWVGYDYDYDVADAYYSTDGETWTQMTGLESEADAYSIVYADDRFVIFTNDDEIYYSTDGASWIYDNYMPGSYGIELLSYGNGIFIAGKSNAVFKGDVIFGSKFSFDEAVFKSYATYYGNFKFKYNGTQWIYNEESVTLANYGLTVFETPELDDYINVLYHMETVYATDVSLSVFRKNSDGQYTEIASGITNARSAYILDPHPSLGTAEYRIIARSTTTGSMAYTDISTPSDETSIFIQWGDDNRVETIPLGVTDDDFVEESFTGTLLELPYNITISESNDKDTSLVEYIGRRHPVSYYGTQVGTKATWTADIPKSDTETLALLRKLDIYQGDVYVREPNGSGYWAQVKISLSINYDSLVIPVSIEITRVDSSEI